VISFLFHIFDPQEAEKEEEDELESKLKSNSFESLDLAEMEDGARNWGLWKEMVETVGE